MSLTPEQFATALLRRLGKPVTPGNVRGLVGWERAEGGHWHNTARFNPLNTTLPLPGAGNTGAQGNIKVYRGWGQGLKATARTLRNGRYGGILQALDQSNPRALARAIGSSSWGTSGSLVAQTIAGTKAPQHLAKLAGAGALDGGGVAPQATTVDAGPQGSALGLLQALSQQPQQPPSVGLAPPSFSAAPALPQAYQAPQAGGGPAAKPDISALLQAAQTSGDTGSTSSGESATGLGAGATGEVTSWAQSRLGHYSESTGKNTGPELDVLENRFGLKGQPWCAIFATTAAVHGGASRATRTASVAQIAQWAQEGSHGYQKGVRSASQAQPGDLVLFGTSHVGFVDYVDKQGIHTIEGNTRSGKVARVVRSTREITGVAKPKYG